MIQKNISITPNSYICLFLRHVSVRQNLQSINPSESTVHVKDCTHNAKI